MSVPAKIGFILLGTCGTFAGGYFIVKNALATKWITLEKSGESEYSGDANKNKFGHKFGAWMVSTIKSENDEFWQQKIKKISGLGTDKQLKDDGYLQEVSGTATIWKNESNDKNTQMNKAVSKLKEKCKAKYDTTQENHEYAESDKDKWKEVWQYCSIEEEGINKMQFKTASQK